MAFIYMRPTSGNLWLKEGGRLSQSLLEKATKERNTVPKGELHVEQSEEVG